MHGVIDPGTKSRGAGGAAVLALTLLAASLLLAGCGKEKAGEPVAGKSETGAGSSCVSCHTDKEKLKVETAEIKQPTGSALQSGKG